MGMIDGRTSGSDCTIMDISRARQSRSAIRFGKKHVEPAIRRSNVTRIHYPI
jgi:hypothetical protein